MTDTTATTQAGYRDSDIPGTPTTGHALTITNPRQRRALLALLGGPVSREQLDRITGASNSPNVIRLLRCNGFEIPCTYTEEIDRDGKPCTPGMYGLTESDKALTLAMLTNGRQGGTQ
jgi:hypothetical protein